VLTITVRVMAGLLTLRPVTGGVPLPEGAAPAETLFILQDEQGKSVPLQTTVLARWKDGSARWVLLDFQTQGLPDKAARKFAFSWHKPPLDFKQASPPQPVTTQAENERVCLKTGGLALSVTDEAILRISDRLDVDLLLTDEDGETCKARVECARIETAGEMRSTLSVLGAFRRPDNDRRFQFRLRGSAYAGLPLVRLEPLVLVDSPKGVVQRIRELNLVVRPRRDLKSGQIGGDPGWRGAVRSDLRLLQYDDRDYLFEGAEGKGTKAPGWAELDDGRGPVAFAMRDFWQQWPKGIEVSPKGLAIGLFPRFKKGDFTHMQPEHKYQWLFHEDCYQLRTGQARRWDIWLDLAGGGASLSRYANAPFIPAADSAQAIATGVWDAITPAGTPEMAKFDPWAEKLFNAYCYSIEAQRDYGAMNWGDWFGERVVNWGNNEYDTVGQILIQFARTGDPRYLYAADAAAHHSAEVDTVHYVNDDLAKYFGPGPAYPPRPGMVHQHTVGHVSGLVRPERVRELLIQAKISEGRSPYLCTDPHNLGHLWTQGMARQYLLTGEPFLKETVETIGNNLAKLAEDRQYKFMGHNHCGRTTGWPLLALAGAYEIGRDERYLKAMKLLVDDALKEQDPHCGGWLYTMGPGHCDCVKSKHVGMAGFITSILINGLSRYYLMTGDERLPKAIDRAVTFLNNDTWREEWRDWRYTSCPATSRMGQMGVIMMAVVNGARIGKNPEHLRILHVAWDAKFKRLLEASPAAIGQGKAYTSTMYGCAETVGLLTSRDPGK
jgi:hypothetical protein